MVMEAQGIADESPRISIDVVFHEGFVPQPTNWVISDYEYIRDGHFYLDDPTRDAYAEDPAFVAQIDVSSVILWLDNGNGAVQEEFTVFPGIAVLDLKTPERTPEDAVYSDTLYFEQLEQGRDYTIYSDGFWNTAEEEASVCILLKRYLDDRSTLGVTYYDEEREAHVGGFDENSMLHVKMIRPADEVLEETISEGVWGPTNRLMFKNVYSLTPHGAIFERDFELSIHYLGTIGEEEEPDHVDGITFIRFVGLDYFLDTPGGVEIGQDGEVDLRWVDFERALLFMPDPEPFGPTGREDLRSRPGDPSSWDILPDAYRNYGIYDRRSCVRERAWPGSDPNWESKFYFEVRCLLKPWPS
jgi:hypothetical protein